MSLDPDKTYTDDQIEHAMATVARVIELYGDAYWPILERLESELEDRRAKSARLTKHLKMFRSRRRPIPKDSPPQIARGGIEARSS